MPGCQRCRKAVFLKVVFGSPPAELLRIGSLVAQWGRAACQCRRHRFSPQVRKIPWRRKWQPAPVFLSGEIHGQWSLAGYSPWRRKESNTIEQLNVHKDSRTPWGLNKTSWGSILLSH